MFVKVTTSDGRPAWLKAEDVSHVYEDWVQLKHNTGAYKLPPGHGEALVRLLCAYGGEQPSEPVDLAEFMGAEKAEAGRSVEPFDFAAFKRLFADAVIGPGCTPDATGDKTGRQAGGVALPLADRIEDLMLGLAKPPEGSKTECKAADVQAMMAALYERDAVGVGAVEVLDSEGWNGKVEIGFDAAEGADKAVTEPVNPTCTDPTHCHSTSSCRGPKAAQPNDLSKAKFPCPACGLYDCPHLPPPLNPAGFEFPLKDKAAVIGYPDDRHIDPRAIPRTHDGAQPPKSALSEIFGPDDDSVAYASEPPADLPVKCSGCGWRGLFGEGVRRADGSLVCPGCGQSAGSEGMGESWRDRPPQL